IIENNLREKDYTFDYEKQPSKAMFKYRNAFIRNDGERYNEFLNKASCGEVNIPIEVSQKRCMVILRQNVVPQGINTHFA
ncbi:MAG: hypothetical protein IIX11_07230, partial [Selenomonadales bacterium]|nr:hypothetical protein [Selenomonadales bacterium]